MTTIIDYSVKEKAQWCPGCVLPDTLIHTNPDVAEIKDLEAGDRVLGSDGRYHKITEIMSHNHTGKMYKLTVKNFGTCDLTHEHPVYVARREKVGRHNHKFELEWVEAENLRPGDYIAYPIPKTTVDLERLEVDYEKKEMDRKSKALPHVISASEDLLRLAGYYLAEGYIHNREVVFTFNTNEKEYADDISNIISKIFGLKTIFKARPEKNTLDVKVSSSLLARLFRKWFGSGAQRKRIPHFAMLLPKEKQAELLKGLWRGDGWVSPRRTQYKTISKVLCHQIKLLLLRQGIVPTIHTEKSYGMHKTAYSIYVIEPEFFNRMMAILGLEYRKENNMRSVVVTDEDYIYLPIRKIETYEYDGIVHNLEVEGVESYVTNNATLHNCGNFAIVGAIKQALNELEIPPHETVVCSGIGCSSKLPHYLRTYGYESIHGRGLPVASGIKLANHKLNVISVGGDGDGYGIGTAHFVHIMRRNYDLTYIVHDNQIYGLTTGQASPTSQLGMKTKTTPYGVIEVPFNPVATAIIGGATFVSRVFAGDMVHMKDVIKQAIEHKGFALVDVLQPCVTFNKLNTYEFFKKRCYKLEDSGHDPSDNAKALEKALEAPSTDYEKIPIGVFFKEKRATYESSLPQIEKMALVEKDLSKIGLAHALEEFE